MLFMFSEKKGKPDPSDLNFNKVGFFITKDKKTIVLSATNVTASTFEGIVVNTKEGSPYLVGSYSKTWPKDDFTAFEGKVELSTKASKDTDFSRLFDLEPFTPPSAALNDLGSAAGPMFDPNLPINDNPNNEPAGFTYFGQFVDHDMTLDRTPLVDAPIDIDQLVNGRDASLLLDSVYGEGPEGNPELYDSQKRFILSNNGRDHNRRADGSAILVEGRNDENMIIAQIHVAVCRFHNAMINQGSNFNKAKEATILHYQYIILNDFLPRICQQDKINQVISGAIDIYDPKNKNRLTMPVEFSGAGFRFAHSAVRRAYRLGADQSIAIQVFNANGDDLRGGQVIPPNKIIQWSNFFSIPGTTNPQPPINISRKIDTLLSSGLFVLPPGSIPTGGSVFLAQRNLIRGKSYGLPSGQDVAQELGIPPLSNAQLGLTDPRFDGKSPLWYYILAEANILNNGTKLGPVGSTIVAAVIIGLLINGGKGIFHPSNKNFVPITGPTFRMGDFLKIAGVA